METIPPPEYVILGDKDGWCDVEEGTIARVDGKIDDKILENRKWCQDIFKKYIEAIRKCPSEQLFVWGPAGVGMGSDGIFEKQ